MITIKKSIVLLIFCFFQPAFAAQKKVFSAAYESAMGIAQQKKLAPNPLDEKQESAYESALKDKDYLSVAAWAAKQNAQKKDKRKRENKEMLERGKKALAFCLESQKKDLDQEQFFRDIKKVVEKSPFRMKDWTKASTLSDQEISQITNCYGSAKDLIGLMAVKVVTTFTIFPQSNLHNQYGGSYGRFCAKDSGGSFSSPVAQKLFDSSGKEHLVFLMQLGTIENGYQANHGFVVEKLNTYDERRYRIYQSFYKGFTLAQWVGVDKWPKKKWVYKNACLSDFFDRSYAKYGNGRRVTEDELHSFIVSNLYIRDFSKAVPNYNMPSSLEYIMPPYFFCGVMKAADKITV